MQKLTISTPLLPYSLNLISISYNRSGVNSWISHSIVYFSMSISFFDDFKLRILLIIFSNSDSDFYILCVALSFDISLLILTVFENVILKNR